MRAGHREAAALGIALRTCRGADGVQRLLLQQRLVAVQRVERAQAFVQLRTELVQSDLHAACSSNKYASSALAISANSY